MRPDQPSCPAAAWLGTETLRGGICGLIRRSAQRDGRNIRVEDRARGRGAARMRTPGAGPEGTVPMTSDPDEFDVDLRWLRSKPGLKWRSVGPDGLAAWLADMDFPAPPPVREALAALVAEGDLGYPDWLHDAIPLREAFASRMAQRYRWSPDPGQVPEFTDIIQALQAVLHVKTAPGDAVAMHLPANPPFLEALAVKNRRLVRDPRGRPGHRGAS